MKIEVIVFSAECWSIQENRWYKYQIYMQADDERNDWLIARLPNRPKSSAGLVNKESSLRGDGGAQHEERKERGHQP